MSLHCAAAHQEGTMVAKMALLRAMLLFTV